MNKHTNPRLCRIIGKYISGVVNNSVRSDTSIDINQELDTYSTDEYHKITAFDKINAFLNNMINSVAFIPPEADLASVVNYIRNRENA